MTAKSRKSGGSWKPGQSGNPAGRKPGSGRVAELRAGLEARLPEVLDKLEELALGGDVAAIRLVLDRTVPPRKPTDEPIALPLSGDLTSQAGQIVSAVSEGVITPDQASALMSVVTAQAKIVEIDDLAKRVAALEARSAPQGSAVGR